MKKAKEASESIDLPKVIEAYRRAYEADRENKALANEAKAFAAGDGQWPAEVRAQREADGNLCLTVNMCPSFIAQVANDIRMSSPAIRVVATGGIGETEPSKEGRERVAKKAADIRQSLIRHVENRSVAQKVAYSRGAGDLVTCGYGGWRIKTEYASETSLLQELRIETLHDAVGVVWDEAALSPTREDARFCFVPVDITREDFKLQYPDATEAAFDETAPEYAAGIWTDWVSAETVRIAEYWFKKRVKGQFVSPDGARLIPVEDADAADMIAAGAEIIERETTCVYRAVISISEVLEKPKKWLGRYIPIVPLFGPEMQIGSKRRRVGLIEHAKDAQRRLNFFSSAEAQAVAMQPKAPFIGTDKHFEGFEDQWAKANTANYPYLKYNHDPQAPGGPQRVQPAVSSQGYAEGIELALGDMKRIIGIYDAALGQRSNETSGKAILARQRESDVGSYEYTLNFTLGIQYTGKILLDLVPRVYDTERTFRVMGEDGKIDAVTINQVASPEDAQNAEAAMLINDISAGEYDVVIESGPSFTTRRDEAREAMQGFAQSDPTFLQIAGDVVAAASGMEPAIVKRLRARIPPQILEAEKAEEGDNGQMQQQGPPPELIAEIEQKVMSGPDFALKDAQARKAMAEAEKAAIEVQAMVMQPTMPQPAEPAPPAQPDPMEMIQVEVMKKRALTQVDLDAEAIRAKRERGEENETDPETGEVIPTQTQALIQAVGVLADQVQQQSSVIAEGQQATAEAMQMLAKTMAAPKTVVRDNRNQIVGVQTQT